MTHDCEMSSHSGAKGTTHNFDRKSNFNANPGKRDFMLNLHSDEQEMTHDRELNFNVVWGQQEMTP